MCGVQWGGWRSTKSAMVVIFSLKVYAVYFRTADALESVYRYMGFETVGNQNFMLGNDQQTDLIMQLALL